MTERAEAPFHYFSLDTPGGPLEIVAQTEDQARRIASEGLGYPPPYKVTGAREPTQDEIDFARSEWGWAFE